MPPSKILILQQAQKMKIETRQALISLMLQTAENCRYSQIGQRMKLIFKMPREYY